jgi:16S rRNA (guanine527-N7)-methyltransferase
LIAPYGIAWGAFLSERLATIILDNFWSTVDLLRAKSDILKLIDNQAASLDILIEHLQLVLEANQSVNLTSITDFNQAMYLHIYDSLLGLQALSDYNDGSFADIGSGGGYPGIPLAVLSGRPAVLIESIRKKANLLTTFVERLELTESISVLPYRAEEVASIYSKRFAIVTARAVSTLISLMELASPLLEINGALIAYKGREGYKEIETARFMEDTLGMTIDKVYEYQIPMNDEKRLIITVKKQQESRISLPRKIGKAQNSPLIV